MFTQGLKKGVPEFERLKLTAEIKTYIHCMSRNQVQGNIVRFNLAQSLIGLLATFQTSEVKNERKLQFDIFLTFLDSEFQLKRASFFAYKSYYDFVNDYPRFRIAPVPFTIVHRNVKKLREWLVSPESKNAKSEYQTAKFWKSVPTEAHTASTNFLVDGGIDECITEISLLGCDE